MKRFSAKSTLQAFFQRNPGSETVKNLKDGASLNVKVGRELFTLIKRNGEIVFDHGEHAADISVRLNKATLEFICSSKDIDELISRVKKCINSDDGSFRISYSIEASIPRLIAKGYLGFARRIGLF